MLWRPCARCRRVSKRALGREPARMLCPLARIGCDQAEAIASPACACRPAGDWRRAYAFVTALTCWNLLPQKDAVLAMLRAKLQEEGLRTYLLAYGRFYSSLSIAQLCDMFELPERRVHAIVSRLIADDGLPASHDQPTGTIVVHHVEPTRLQTLAGTFSDKASLLVDLNERALAMRTGEQTQGAGSLHRRMHGWAWPLGPRALRCSDWPLRRRPAHGRGRERPAWPRWCPGWQAHALGWSHGRPWRLWPRRQVSADPGQPCMHPLGVVVGCHCCNTSPWRNACPGCRGGRGGRGGYGDRERGSGFMPESGECTDLAACGDANAP